MLKDIRKNFLKKIDVTNSEKLVEMCIKREVKVQNLLLMY